uniref:Uncharacterized protein n=1 Tax=Rhizophora mucronata TaxID=61149 RepID=A0A2P2NYK7_RHIMU
MDDRPEFWIFLLLCGFCTCLGARFLINFVESLGNIRLYFCSV